MNNLYERLEMVYGGEKTNRQLQILAAAIETFVEKGYAASTTSEIAKRAGVAEGTIFKHFKTKRELLLAIPEFVSRLTKEPKMIESFKNMISGQYDSFERFLRAFMQDRKQFAEQNVYIIKLFLQEISFHPEIREHIKNTLIMPSIKGIAMQIEKFKAKGEIAQRDTADIISFIISTLIGHIFIKVVFIPEIDWTNEQQNVLIEIITKALK